MMNRHIFSAASKKFGRGKLSAQSARSVTMLSSVSGSSVANGACAIDQRASFAAKHNSSKDNATALVRSFSSMSLRRPPAKHSQGRGNGNGKGDRKQKWRSHAVSLDFGNYQDDFADDQDDEYYYSNTDAALASPDARGGGSSSSWHEEESQLAENVQEIQRQEDERRKRWLENAKPPVRRPIIDERGRAYGRGGRKTASARVWIQPGFGTVVVNKKDFVEYFDRMTDRELILEPLAATETLGRFDVTVTVEGGGLTGQAGAIRHGLARALNHYNPDEYRPPLKRLGYLTRDPRKVERKKIGHLKARKKPQWVKR